MHEFNKSNKIADRRTFLNIVLQLLEYVNPIRSSYE